MVKSACVNWLRAYAPGEEEEEVAGRGEREMAGWGDKEEEDIGNPTQTGVKLKQCNMRTKCRNYEEIIISWWRHKFDIFSQVILLHSSFHIWFNVMLNSIWNYLSIFDLWKPIESTLWNEHGLLVSGLNTDLLHRLLEIQSWATFGKLVHQKNYATQTP